VTGAFTGGAVHGAGGFWAWAHKGVPIQSANPDTKPNIKARGAFLKRLFIFIDSFLSCFAESRSANF